MIIFSLIKLKQAFDFLVKIKCSKIREITVAEQKLSQNVVF